MSIKQALLGIVVVVAAIVTVIAYERGRHSGAGAASVKTTAGSTTHAAASRASAVPMTEPQFVQTYIDVVRSAYPGFATTQPLGVPLDLRQAAHIRLADAVYLSRSGRPDLWITRADAAPTI